MKQKEHASTVRRRLAVVAASAACLAILVGLLLTPRAPPPREGRAAPEPEAAVEIAEARRGEPVPQRPEGGGAAEQVDERPIIDEVLVEKDEVCSGEENLITIRAHTPNGTDGFLHYTIGKDSGPQIPLRLSLKQDGTVDMPKIRVFGRNNAMTEIDMPRYRVKDCKPARIVTVVPRLLPNSIDEYELQARVLEAGSKDDPSARPFEPVSYKWKFGDGSEEITTAPRVIHSYEERSHESATSSFLVAVEVVDQSGESLVGRASLDIMSSVFGNYAERGIVTVVAIPTPRFPEMDAQGVVHQSFRLRHFRESPVRIERVHAVRHYMATGESSPPESMDQEASLGLTTIPPGSGVEISLDLDTSEEQDVFAVTYVIEGVTEDGLEARGSFSLMRPPPRPTREANIPVRDPLLQAKILRARELLHQEFVTDEDIWRLEREGKLAALDVGPAPAEPAQDHHQSEPAPQKKPPPGVVLPPGVEDAL
ncbi:MAG: hypothetical protein IT372_39415 [Polyangiaceae bacterium]|nr:hypothetical protein [Polyangiaceae bacterium]